LYENLNEVTHLGCNDDDDDDDDDYEDNDTAMRGSSDS